MSDIRPLASGRRLSDFFSHLVEMPRWHKRLLVLMTALFGAGAVGQAAGYLSATPTRAVQPEAGMKSSYVRVDDKTSTEQAKPTITQKLSPHAIKIGVSFIIAFIIGWLARAFVKIVTTLAALAVAATVGLNHLGIVNIDLTSVQHEASANAHGWISLAQHYTSTLIHLLPSSVSGGAGMWVGFRRR